MSPHPSLAAVSAGLRALVSWLLAFGLIDVVCLGPVSLFPGLSSFGWFNVVCLGLSSASLGCLSSTLSVVFGVQVCVRGSFVCPGLGSVSTCLMLSPASLQYSSRGYL